MPKNLAKPNTSNRRKTYANRGVPDFFTTDYLSGGFHGERLNEMRLENVGETEILAVLDECLGRYARERLPGEHFGDFCVRTRDDLTDAGEIPD